LGLIAERDDEKDRDLGCKGNKEVALLVEALPQLRALELYNCAEMATDAGP
jgi:hypothetical protein